MFKTMAILSLLCLSAFCYSSTLYPDLKTSQSALGQRMIDSTTMPGRILLRLSNGVANIGKGPLELKGGTVHEDGSRDVYQVIYNSWGGKKTRLAGTFQQHPEHHHTHFNNFSLY